MATSRAAVGATPSRIIDRYVLHGEISSGGMATVHYGRLRGPVGFSRTVAIKRLHPHYARDPRFVAMFTDEARLAARVRHPNVVPTLDVVTTEDELFLVMEYVAGESLSRLLRATSGRDEQIPIPVTASILVGVLHGLHAAHEARDERGELLHLVHRDVSPQNVLVGSDGVSRVLDFGVAKAIGRLQETGDGKLKGKFPYMAPEQFEGESTRRSDVYAAGVVLWETLTGERLFHEDNVSVVVARILRGDVPRPTSIVAALPPALEAIALKALARDPSRRFATAEEMANALEECAEVALPSKVAAWIERTAGPALARRAAEVRAIESGDDDGAPELPPPEPEPIGAMAPVETTSLDAVAPPLDPETVTVPLGPRRRVSARRPAVWIALGAVAVGMAGVIAIATARARPPTPAASMALPGPTPAATSAAPSAPAAPSTPEPPAAAEPSAASPTAPSSVPRAAASPPETTPPRSRSSPRPPSAKPRKPDCDHPFTTDASGVKHFRPECL